LNKPGSVNRGRVFRARKGLGQHFLKDREIARKIVSMAGFAGEAPLLEIGPGTGALTLLLARTGLQIIAVEKDRQLAERLQRRLDREGIRNVTLVAGDILRQDFGEWRGPGEGQMGVIGNLPYSISSPILDMLIRNRALVNRAVLMFQSEFARRVSASPGSREYGAMSVLIQYFSRVSPLLEVPREAFSPVPKVDSMVLELDFNIPYPRRAENERSFKKTVKGAFSHRRKTLLNSLRGALPDLSKETILDVLKRCSIDPGKRAETLSMENFLDLNTALYPFLDN
jgi:16S rRNA (adenine1518-N6/adenine1519-N6)-dimethyltransferase